MRKSAFTAALVAACLLGAGSAHAQSPSPDPDPASRPIRPGQFFAGLVNGRAPESAIVLSCSNASRTGHPVAGQHVSVRQLFPPSIDTSLGFTGRASTIAATLRIVSPSSSTAAAPIPLAVFSLYDAPVAIPTTLNLPCGGAGAVVFDPVQGGNTAQSYANRVRFVSITPAGGVPAYGSASPRPSHTPVQ
jgi:hypothetical protein